MEVLKEIKNLETEGHKLIERAEREGEKRLAEAEKSAAESKDKTIAGARAQADKIIEEGRKKGLEDAGRISAATAKEIGKIRATASRKRAGSKKTIFKRLLDV